MPALCGRVPCQKREWSAWEGRGVHFLCFHGWTIDASLIHDAGFVENIAFAKLILKRPAYLGRDNQPDLSQNNPSFHSFTSFIVSSFFLLSFFPSLHHSLPSLLPSVLRGPTCTSLTTASANTDRHCLSTSDLPVSVGLFVEVYIGGCL